MPSLEAAAGAGQGPAAGTLVRLLDPAFGFFVWSVHFLAVYVAAAVACVQGLGAADAGTRSAFLTALVAATAAAAAVVLLHAVLRYRRLRDRPDARVRMEVTIGGDAVAAVAILWQLSPLLLVPVCA